MNLGLRLAVATVAGLLAILPGRGWAQQVNAAQAAPQQPASTLVVAQANQAPAASSPSGPAEGCGDKAKEDFFDRFIDTYKEHLNWTGEDSGPAPQYRGAPPAVSSPPFPYSIWPIGGTEAIGYDNTYYGALMDTLYCGPHGQALKDSRFTIYGWIEPSLNLTTSHEKYSIASGFGGNYPAAYPVYPNQFQMDQVALYFERTPDMVQTDHVDWGFRIANLWGSDYKYTFAQGILSNQYIAQHLRYGYDPVMVYGDLYFPQVAMGMDVRVGRYISVPDIEAQLAKDNLTFTHSLLYTYDPYTQTGIVDTIKLTRNWTVQLAFSGGNDVAPWSQYTKPTPAACVQWTSDSGNDALYPCANGINGGVYGYNNLQHDVITWYHKFNDKWHMATEAYYMYERDVPSVNPAAGALTAPTTSLIANANGAVCPPQDKYCFAPTKAIVNYLMYQVGPKDYLTLRNELFDDAAGQRTGFRSLYSEHTIAWIHWIGDQITIRPELRFERAYQARAYDNTIGPSCWSCGSKNQLIFSADTIFHF